ncbi:N-acetylneuraminate synthase family protein [Halalkaliarchaeum sp. AArc-GB]|uniref:N-acetylneuraminate synthase family protein n=1 Tax=Halalkaliarchaeum sp. AArc-GB TaxID=3074078 RepID=UPI00285DCEEB|nr:N-acetylneuraminate synthase family protein [Halalkaliarchaeum sp. AArc-GB]MDR5674225.1 N-acetylneuraminate synthase family protein [Halalkaliarchaeum sp. AArc-GB]
MCCGNPFDPEEVYFIAEAGVNHNGSLERAKKMIDVAEDAGADAIKFQSYVAEASVVENEQKVKYQAENTDEMETQLEMLQRYELSRDDHEVLIKYCADSAIDFLTTVSTIESVNKIRDFDLPLLKIGSPDLNNFPTLEYVLELDVPLIISTGMSYMNEVLETYEFVRDRSEEHDIAFLHCVSDYPADPSELNLKAIETMRNQLSCPVGFSDHTIHPETPSIAVGSGASIIEKHFTLDKSLEGPDHEASLEPAELDRAISLVRLASEARGDGTKEPAPSEVENRTKVRRSIHTTTSLTSGDTIHESDIRICRPADGLEPKYWNQIIGTEVARSLESGEPLQEDHVQL